MLQTTASAYTELPTIPIHMGKHFAGPRGCTMLANGTFCRLLLTDSTLSICTFGSNLGADRYRG